MSHYESKEAKCPFYKGEKKPVIYCEGAEPDCTINLAFGRGDNYERHKKKKCGNDYKSCIVYACLNAMWEDRLKRRK